MAAIFAARTAAALHRQPRVIAVDSAAKLGAKILIAGGGRCNVTHEVVTPDDFNASNRNQLAKVLRSFTVQQTVAFFAELGVALKREETGKLFPVTDRARTVLEALLQASHDSGVELVTGAKAERIEVDGEEFVVTTSRGSIRSRTVVIAAGGRSVPKTGSDGSSYLLAESLGHSITPLFPALVPLLLPPQHWLTELSGVSLEAEARVTNGRGKVMARRRGSMLLTHFGLSGPLILDISRHWIQAHQSGLPARLEVSLAKMTAEELEQMITGAAVSHPRQTVAGVASFFTSDRFGRNVITHETDMEPDQRLGQLTRAARDQLVRVLTSLMIPVTGDRGFDYAEVTAGGVPLQEVDSATMESRARPGLFLCGEIMDVDGRIGGFNFQWAWTSGRLAGIHAAQKLRIENCKL